MFPDKKEKNSIDDKANKKLAEKQQYHFNIAENSSNLFAELNNMNTYSNNKNGVSGQNGNMNIFQQGNIFSSNPWNQQNNL